LEGRRGSVCEVLGRVDTCKWAHFRSSPQLPVERGGENVRITIPTPRGIFHPSVYALLK
jgi:hypothetical protein